MSALVAPVRNGNNVFLTSRNLLNIFRFASENGIIAVGMTLVILTGGIDLSVGAVMALCAVAAADLMMNDGFGTIPTIVLVLGLGALVGADQRSDHDAAADPVVHHHAGDARRVPRRRLAVGRRLRDPLAFGDGEGFAPPLYKSMFAGELTSSVSRCRRRCSTSSASA